MSELQVQSTSGVGGRRDTSAVASSSNSTRMETSEAEPLPRKVGELGYDPVLHGSLAMASSRQGGSNESTPLGPHPAERTDAGSAIPTGTDEATRTHTRSDTSSTVSVENSPSPVRMTTQIIQSSTSLTPTVTSVSSLTRLTKKLSPSPIPSKHLLGMAPRTLCKFILLFVFLLGVCASWALATKANAEGGGTLFGGNGINVSVFIHVAFAVIVLTTLLFIERVVFRLRAERFSYLHPEVELPMRNPLSRPGNRSGLSFAPWQRPPLPTYAAALRSAATATGDVEDQEVARMVALGSGDVPPIYGNTRGSTLLAYGFGAGPSANRSRPISTSSRLSTLSRTSRLEERETSVVESRPVSYGQSQQIEDALRAQRLADTLGRLEANQ